MASTPKAAPKAKAKAKKETPAQKEKRIKAEKERYQRGIDHIVRRYTPARSEDQEPDEWDTEPRPPRAWVDHPFFNLLMGLVIGINAIVLGLETDAKAAGDGGDVVWFLVQLIFTIVFTLELGFRIYYLVLGSIWVAEKTFAMKVEEVAALSGIPLQPPKVNKVSFIVWGLCLSLKRSGFWLRLDFFLVCLSLFDLIAMLASLGSGGLKLVLMLRFLRLVRLLRLIRLFKFFKELWLVAAGVMRSVATLLWICILLFLCIYVSAVITTLVVGHDNELYDKYFTTSGGWDHEVFFGTVARSMLSLLQVATGDGWGDEIVRHVVDQQPAMLLFFIVFLAITFFGLLNIIVGVVVETTLSIAEGDENVIRAKEEKDRQMVFGQLRKMFEEADTDGSGQLSLPEVQEAVDQPEVYNKLNMIGFPVDDPGRIFQLLDFDDSGELTVEEFIAGCMRMRGPAKSKDLLEAKILVDKLGRHLEDFEREEKVFKRKLLLLDATARSLVNHGEHAFLNSQEYRLRHPDFKDNEVPVIEQEKLDTAPWVKLSQGKGDVDILGKEALAGLGSSRPSSRATGASGSQSQTKHPNMQAIQDASGSSSAQAADPRARPPMLDALSNGSPMHSSGQQIGDTGLVPLMDELPPNTINELTLAIRKS